jgi:hypothetical protein
MGSLTFVGGGARFPVRIRVLIAGLTVVSCLLGPELIGAQPQPAVALTMGFFVTSVGRGFGADLAGLAGADAHCQQLAAAVGRGNRTWRAYLSAPASAGRAVVHARDRIGNGPWLNAKGIQVASSVADLHSDANALGRDNSLSEKGNFIGPGRHDILTGTNVDGTLSTDAPDTTCQGWTSHAAGRAMLGHHNRSGGGQRPTSWNSAHLSIGCSQADLRATLGDALLYCFAAD